MPGIKVGEARDYFATHGGEDVYDGNFRLPYYDLPRMLLVEVGV